MFQQSFLLILLITLFFLKLGFVFPTLFFKLIVISGLYKMYSNCIKSSSLFLSFQKTLLISGFVLWIWETRLIWDKKNHLSLADISCPFCSINYHFKSSCLESQKESIVSLRLKLQMFVMGAGNQNQALCGSSQCSSTLNHLPITVFKTSKLAYKIIGFIVAFFTIICFCLSSRCFLCICLKSTPPPGVPFLLS